MKPCPQHKEHGLGYLQWQDYAKEHQKKYGKQKQCPECKRWYWPDEWDKKKPVF